MESVSENNQKTIDSAYPAAVQDWNTPTEQSPAPVREMFEAMLTGWAFDWLRLLSRGLDQPTCMGREMAVGAEIEADEETAADEHSGVELMNHIRRMQPFDDERVRRISP